MKEACDTQGRMPSQASLAERIYDDPRSVAVCAGRVNVIDLPVKTSRSRPSFPCNNFVNAAPVGNVCREVGVLVAVGKNGAVPLQNL